MTSWASGVKKNRVIPRPYSVVVTLYALFSRTYSILTVCICIGGWVTSILWQDEFAGAESKSVYSCDATSWYRSGCRRLGLWTYLTSNGLKTMPLSYAVCGIYNLQVSMGDSSRSEASKYEFVASGYENPASRYDHLRGGKGEAVTCGRSFGSLAVLQNAP